MCARMLQPTAIKEDCPHVDAEPFGSEGHTSFQRCRTCGKTLTLHASRGVPLLLSYPAFSLR